MNPNDNLLEGRWRVESQMLANNKQWVIYESFPANGCVWTFRTGAANPHPKTNGIAYNGDLTEDDSYMPGFDPPAGDGTAEFAYHTRERTLYIYRPSPDIYACATDIYRVGHNGQDGLALYSLEGVDTEPGGYYFRLILSRVP